LQETLATQDELVLERDRAEAAMRQSQALLRVFQVQSATDLSLARYLKDVLERVQSRQIGGQAMDLSALPLQVEVLTKPHDRLIVRGDWQWASSRFPSEIINAAFQVSSREAAQALSKSQHEAQRKELPSSDQVQLGMPASGMNAAQDRDLLQAILLEELRKILPPEDPFIAEVLDNCGMQALDRNDLRGASQYLAESVRKWGKTDRYPANLAQSQLFLADVLLRQSQIEQAESVLNQAQKSLERVPSDSAHYEGLSEFTKQLRTQLRNTK